MPEITRELLHAYLDDALSEAETAEVERAIRNSEALQKQLRQAIQERDRGDHSIGAIWRRHRLTCPSREELGSYLLQVLDDDAQDYIKFHLETIGCSWCLANLADLQSLQKEPPPVIEKRRRRFIQSSAGILNTAKTEKS